MHKALKICAKLTRPSLILATALCFAVVLTAATGFAPPAAASEPRVGRSGLPLPRFASVKREEANLRRGPGLDYPILWVLTRRGLPVKIVAEYGHWRRVELHDGARGWVHRALLSGRRTAILIGEPHQRELRAEPLEQAERVARVGEITPLRLTRCDAQWCETVGAGVRGWAPKQQLWGVAPGEEFD